MPPEPRAAISSLDHLTSLFASLGYQPALEPVIAPADGVLRAALLARHGAFRISGIEVAGDPIAAARHHAALMAKEMERGITIAFSRRRSALAMGTWTAGPRVAVRPLAAAAAHAPTRDLLERLRPRSGESALALHLRVAAILSTEGVSDRFFRAMRRVVDRFTAECPLAVARADARVLAVGMLIRVMFLYFVQAKGWLAGERDYLRRRLDVALARRVPFQRDVLEPLMFGALCHPPDRRRRWADLGPVPFLNGGLFERTRQEARHGRPEWPNATWRGAFDGLFDRFQFSVRETGGESAVEPDMLGRIFEGIMEAPRRRQTGTYYTPHRLVLELLDLALVPLLAGRAGVEPKVVRAALTGTRPSKPRGAGLLEAMRHLTLLDPAAGSGAFLLGALERLEALHNTILGPHVPPPHRLRRRILKHNLYGVDVDPVAVRLAELRLWLAVIADDPAAAPSNVAPLPNLDGVVRQGDSLLDPVTVATAGAGATVACGVRHQVARVAENRLALFGSIGPAKRRATAALRRSELHLAREVLTGALARVERDIAALLSHARRPTLFETGAGLDEAGRRMLRTLRARRRAARTALRGLHHDDAVPFFAFELHWPDILAAGGFDLVVGNPPWVRGERLPRALRVALATRYRTYRTSGRGFAHPPDLAQAFVERAVELAAPGGVVALLVPSKLGTAGYSAPLRALLARETTIECVRPIGSSETFHAAVYPTAMVVKKAPPPASHRSRFAHGPWIALQRGEQALVDQLRGVSRRVSDYWTPHLGAKTGANDLFLGRVTNGQFTSLSGATALIDVGRLRPAIRGRDVTPFACRSSFQIVWTHGSNGQPLERLPPDLVDYLGPFAERLGRRADARDQPWWALFRTGVAAPVPRTVWRDLARVLCAVAIPEESRAVPLNTCYVVLHERDDDAHALAALFNSSPLRWLARLGADEARGGYRRFNARVVGGLPLPDPGPVWDELARMGRATHINGKTSDRSDDELDDLAASAFDLSAVARRALARVASPLR